MINNESKMGIVKKQVKVSSEAIREYYNELNSHDWWYEYSDDFSVYRKGNDRENFLRNKSSLNNEHFVLYHTFMNWKNGKRERPVIEEFL